MKSIFILVSYKIKSNNILIHFISRYIFFRFEHFYIYDNDPTQHGPLETLLRPYLLTKNPIVTYIWYPIKDCIRAIPDDDFEGHRMAISQALSTNGALH